MTNSGASLIEEVNTTNVPFGTCAYWWLGQHGFIVKLGETVIYIDAYLSPDGARNIAPLLEPLQVTNADLIIGTHDHSDHIDRPMWPIIAEASPTSVFLAPLYVYVSLLKDLKLPKDRLIGLDDGLSPVVNGVKVTAIPAAHEHLSTDPETGLHEFLGVIVEGNGFCFYHAGDTCIYEGIQSRLRHWKIDLAFLPINGRDAKRLKSGCIGNMTYQEAVDLAGSIKAQWVVPTHFEMFNGNTEDPSLFLDYLNVKYPSIKSEIPQHGQRVVLSAE